MLTQSTQIGIIFHVLHPKPSYARVPHPPPSNGDAIRKNIFLILYSKTSSEEGRCGFLHANVML
jgi:hypothetical protein